MAEEEILKEAEQYYKEQAEGVEMDFQKTNKNLSFLPLILSQAQNADRHADIENESPE